MTYRLKIKRNALKQLEKLPAETIRLIDSKIQQLKKDPFAGDVKKLKNLDGLFRLRVSNYRILFTVFHDILIIEIISISHRKDVYKQL